ncbi:hypothetical protein AA0472_1314 [Acetobacter estunensis NRIC 0472]|uniref:DUF3293 domain-containing protein n=1 Tax=Acetobacter estunensis TaxID=104097 RepID=A0A967BCV8_9PROT|nr:DUF3293 domain-containing protein [Acetobacter estunensis]NHO54047.1 DUF3293 domain-containing protein [Acetobacter estunensis]GBQ24114.1 hypothetical protein AA0472_1314 [Acetobacter estunensis NRIC 0472]
MTARIRPLTPALLRAYRLTIYRAGPLEVRIGQRTPGLKGHTFIFLGAANPGGRRYPDAWNTRMTQRLRHRLRHVAFFIGDGRLGQWCEPMIAAALPLARALRLARLFRQNAVVVAAPDRPARLVPVSPHTP